MLYQDDDWVCFKNRHPGFLQCVRSGILPVEHRRFDSAQKQWMVYWERLPTLVSIANKFFGEVDRSSLPSAWQLYAAGGTLPPRTKLSKRTTAFNILFLTDDAPLEVVKASYSALVLMYHPDSNDGKGDPERLQQIVEAYHSIVD